MNYNKDIDSPDIGMFNEFSEVEEEMIEMIMDKDKNIKIYFCNNVKKINEEKNKNTLAGAFEEPKKFFKENFVSEYKKFCEKYKLLLDK